MSPALNHPPHPPPQQKRGHLPAFGRRLKTLSAAAALTVRSWLRWASVCEAPSPLCLALHWMDLCPENVQFCLRYTNNLP